MNRPLFYYLINDAVVKSAPLLLVLYLSNLLDAEAVDRLAIFTITFSICSNVFSFGQISLLSKFHIQEKENLTFPFNNLILPILINSIIFIVFFAFNLPIALGALMAILWLLFQNIQISNNVRNKFKNYIKNDQSFLMIIVLLIYAWSNIFEINEFIRIFPFLAGYLLINIFSYRKHDFNPVLDIKSVNQNFISGFYVSLYSLFQWYLAFGDKALIRILFDISLSNEVFLLTQFLQIYLLGALAVMKFFRPRIAKAYNSSKTLKKEFIFYLMLLITGNLVTFIIFLYSNNELFSITLPATIIFAYFGTYFMISITYFLYQISIFRSKEARIANITLQNLFLYAVILLFMIILGIKFIHFVLTFLFLISIQNFRMYKTIF